MENLDHPVMQNFIFLINILYQGEMSLEQLDDLLETIAPREDEQYDEIYVIDYLARRWWELMEEERITNPKKYAEELFIYLEDESLDQFYQDILYGSEFEGKDDLLLKVEERMIN